MDHAYWKEQLHLYRIRSLTSAEEDLLWEALGDPANADQWNTIIGEMFREQAPGMYDAGEEWEPVLAAVFNSDRAMQPAAVRRMPVLRRLALVAAVAAPLLVGGYWLLTKYARSEKPSVAQTGLPAKNDIPAPTGTRATLTLDNGQRILLDSVQNGTLVQQGNAQVAKLAANQLAYNVSTEKPAEAVYNTLSTSTGGQTMLVLADGTKVWLNASSSITYPTAFVEKERVVKVTGEAYFEVAKNVSKPFKVSLNGKAEVEVLGTNFNINAYDDESFIKTTLLAGSVRVLDADKKAVVLKPEEQAQLAPSATGTNSDNEIRVISHVDVDAVAAWKNGRFSFQGADLHEVMRQLARWYNLEVQYEGIIPEQHFSGRIGRTLTLDQVLKTLTNTGVHYEIEPGNKLIIRP